MAKLVVHASRLALQPRILGLCSECRRCPRAAPSCLAGLGEFGGVNGVPLRLIAARASSGNARHEPSDYIRISLQISDPLGFLETRAKRRTLT